MFCLLAFIFSALGQQNLSDSAVRRPASVRIPVLIGWL